MLKFFKLVSYALVIVGALNWGLVGLFKFNLVQFLLGSYPLLENIVYDIVGISAVISVITVILCYMQHAES